MSKTRAAVRDFISHSAVYAFLVLPVIFAARVVFSQDRAALLAGAGFSVLYWLYFALRVAVKLRSSRIYRDARFDNGIFAFFLVSSGVFFLASDYLNYSVVLPPAVASAVFLCLCRVVYSHMEGVDQTLGTVAEFSVQPVEEIRRHNNKIIAGFTALAFVSAAAVYFSVNNGTLNGWLGGLGAAIVNLIRSIFGGGSLPAEIPEIPADTPPPPEFEPPVFAGPSPVMLAIGWVIRHMYAALAVVGAVVFAVVFFKYRERQDRSGTVYGNGDVSEAVAPLQNKIKRGFFTGRMPKDPVRRAFYKKVAKHRDLIAASDTAGEIEEKIAPREDIGKLAEAYRAVRYGKEGTQ